MQRGDFDGLLADARAGVPSAWDQLYRRLAPAVAGYLRMQGAVDAEDVTSDVFLGVLRGIGSFSGDEAHFRSWVFVIAHRRLQDARRRGRRRPPTTDVDDASAPSGSNVEDDVLCNLAHERVQALCAQLAPDQRDVLLLRILGDLTVDDVAGVLGKTPGAVKALQRRGFEAVRRLLAREGVSL